MRKVKKEGELRDKDFLFVQIILLRYIINNN